MSDDNKTNASLGAFLTKFTAPVAGIIAFITSLNGFLKLFADKDAGLITILSLIVGILLLFGICLYYARLWKPETDDKSPSAFAPTLTDEQVEAQATKETGRKRVRRAALAGLVLVPVLTLTGIGGWQYVQSLPTKDVIILVADFEGPDPQSYRVTETIRKNLENATEPYPDTKVKLLGKIIKDTPEQSGRDVAREEGKQRKAAIVIWGWYGKTKDTVPISVNFEILKLPKYLPELDKDVKGQVQTAAAAELESFKVQARLSNQMAYLTLMTLGISRYAVDDWDGAIDRLTHALEQVKDDRFTLGQDAVYYARGYSYQKREDYSKAIADYNQVLRLKPDSVEAYINRGLAYSHKQDSEKEIADYNQAIKLKPDYSLPYLNRGYAYLDKQDYGQAIANFTRSIQINEDWGDRNIANAYNGRSRAYSLRDEHERAIADSNQAIKLKPDDADTYLYRGLVYTNKKDYEKAISDFNQAIKLKPDYSLPYLNRGYAYFSKNDYGQAIADYTRSIQINKDWSDISPAVAYIKRGNVYSDKQDYDKAIADFTQALQLKPGYAGAYNNRGVAYGEKKDYDRALADLNQALKLEPDNAYAYDSRGTVYRYKGDFERALSDYNQALKLKPDLAESHLWRGVIYSQRGEKQKAVDDLKAALKGLDDPKLKQWAEAELRKLK